MITNYAVNATHYDGNVVYLDTFPTRERAQGLAEYVARVGGARRVSWGEVRGGGYFPVASAVCAQRGE